MYAPTESKGFPIRLHEILTKAFKSKFASIKTKTLALLKEVLPGVSGLGDKEVLLGLGHRGKIRAFPARMLGLLEAEGKACVVDRPVAGAAVAAAVEQG